MPRYGAGGARIAFLHPKATHGVLPVSYTHLDYHRQTGFAWWRHRAAHLARLYDVVRIDHFRAFHTYWCIPDGASDARGGHWEPGPGMELVEALRSVPGLALIAEDLGDLDADALRFIADSGLPGMKVLVYRCA